MPMAGIEPRPPCSCGPGHGGGHHAGAFDAQVGCDEARTSLEIESGVLERIESASILGSPADGGTGTDLYNAGQGQNTIKNCEGSLP